MVDETGALLGKRRISDDVSGYHALLDLLAEYEHAGEPAPIAIETGRGLIVACLRASGRQVHAINPMVVARYREHHTVARAKPDHADALVLANILRAGRC